MIIRYHFLTPIPVLFLSSYGKSYDLITEDHHSPRMDIGEVLFIIYMLDISCSMYYNSSKYWQQVVWRFETGNMINIPFFPFFFAFFLRTFEGFCDLSNSLSCHANTRSRLFKAINDLKILHRTQSVSVNAIIMWEERCEVSCRSTHESHSVDFAPRRYL